MTESVDDPFMLRFWARAPHRLLHLDMQTRQALRRVADELEHLRARVADLEADCEGRTRDA